MGVGFTLPEILTAKRPKPVLSGVKDVLAEKVELEAIPC